MNDLPIEIIHKILNKCDEKYISKMIFVSKKIYDSKYHLYLVPLFISKYYLHNSITTIQKDIIKSIPYGYTLSIYLQELTGIISNILKEPSLKYIKKGIKNYERKYYINFNYNYGMNNIISKTKKRDILYGYIHKIYRIPREDYETIKINNYNVLALIY